MNETAHGVGRDAAGPRGYVRDGEEVPSPVTLLYRGYREKGHLLPAAVTWDGARSLRLRLGQPKRARIERKSLLRGPEGDLDLGGHTGAVKPKTSLVL
jgi:hypothetical protein